MWSLNQDKDGLYMLEHESKGSLTKLTLLDLEILAYMFIDEVEDEAEDELDNGEARR